MHISFVTPEYPTTQKPEGGLATYIWKTSHQLVRRGHRVSLFIIADEQDIEFSQGINFYFIKPLRFHWRLHRIHALQVWMNLVEQYINSRRVKRVVFAKNKVAHIDILQTPNYKTPGLFICHNKIFPVVCRCSSYQPLLRTANGSQRNLQEAISDWLETRQVIEADAAFSPSETIARIYKRFEAVEPIVIRTPIDHSTTLQDPSIYSKYLDGKKYLLYYGALNGVKGVDLLIQVIPDILSAFDNLSFVLVGRNDRLPGGTKAVDTLHSHCKKYFDENRVIYLPSLPKPQLYPIIEHALGVIMPSRVDNYPNACLEALSLGVPVVGTYDSSLDEIIEDGKIGFLAKNGDPTSLEEAINRLLIQSPMERAEMIENIQQKIGEMHKEDRVEQLLQFYQTAVAEFSKNRQSR